MRIISPFKDYYDYYSKLYGEDNAVTYNRQPFTIKQSEQFNKLLRPVHKDVLVTRYSSLLNHSFTYLVVCNRVYSCVGGKIISADEYKRLFLDYYRNIGMKSNYRGGEEYPQLTELSRFLNAPVYEVRSENRSYDLYLNVPVLANTGIKTSPGKMYTDIYYFIANVLRNSPDSSPPVEIGNKDRIVAHGFDLVSSFRGKL